MKKIVLLLSLIFLSIQYSQAQFPKTFPDDGLDASVGISYVFMNNESQQERQEFMAKFTGLLLEKGFNLMYEAETSASMSEVEKAKITKVYDSLKIKYCIVPIKHSMINSVVITNMLDQKSKRYSDRASFQAALDAFIKDVDKFKASHPNANQVAFEYKVNKFEEDTSSVDPEEQLYSNTDFSSSVNYINELPADLSSQTLLFLMYNDFDVTPEDSALISAEELMKRKKKIAKHKKMNTKFKESFAEYPYPVSYIYEKDLKELSKKHPYQLVDNYRMVTKEVYKSDGSSRWKSVYVHNYCIKDHRKAGTFYRLSSWDDCDKDLENGCLRLVVKSILKKESK